MAKVLGLSTEHIQQSDSYSVLKDLVAGQKELGTAQDAFCQAVEDKWMPTQNPGDVEELLGQLWSSIEYLAASTSFKDAAQQKLVDFVVQLQKRPTLEKDGQVCEVHGMTVWKDLPMFGWAVRDAWNFSATDNSDQVSKDQWININAFVAALLASDPNDHLGLSLFAVWTSRQALEEKEKTSDVSLAAAAAWFVYAGPTLQKFSSQEKTFDGKVAKPGPAFQDKEWRGFSQERWQAWQQKFSDAQGQVSDGTVKELVQQALQAMNEC